MLDLSSGASQLPDIPSKRYFTIGEVVDLCEVKAHILRYWEQEFAQLSPVKRRGNRRYYKREDVMRVREIKNLLYDQGYTIGGARQVLSSESSLSQSGQGVSERQKTDDLIRNMISDLEDVLLLLDS